MAQLLSGGRGFELKRIGLAIVGTLIYAVGMNLFVVPAALYSGGVMGFSQIIRTLLTRELGLSFRVDIAATLYYIFNVPILILAWRKLDRSFVLKTLLAVSVMTVAMTLIPVTPVLSSDTITSCLVGGVIAGCGVGLVLRGGGCLDGTETVALLISRRTRLSVGQVVFGINILIYGAAGLLFGWDRAMYSLMTYFISFKIIDMVEEGLEQAKSVMIITDDGAAMADAIYTKLGRTCTMMEGTGRISGEKSVLYCVVTRVELSAVRRIIRDADGSAFVTISDVSEIVGNHIKQHPDPQPEAAEGP